jgi:hypothetical protein
MTASRGKGGAGKGVPGLPLSAAVADRITVALVPKAADDLQNLQNRTSLSKTDLVNRAITLYEFFDAQQRVECDVLVRDKQTGDVQTVLFL